MTFTPSSPSNIHSSAAKIFGRHSSHGRHLSMNGDDFSINPIRGVVAVNVYTPPQNFSVLHHNGRVPVGAITSFCQLKCGLDKASIALRQARVRERQLLWASLLLSSSSTGSSTIPSVMDFVNLRKHLLRV